MFAVWFDVLPGDSRNAWDPSLLNDPRVTSFWDDDGVTGRWFFAHRDAIGFRAIPGVIVWDQWLLFGPEAAWTDIPAPIVGAGFTIIGTAARLHNDLLALWAAPAQPAAHIGASALAERSSPQRVSIGG